MKHTLSTRAASTFLLATALVISGSAFAGSPGHVETPEAAEAPHAGKPGVPAKSKELHAKLTDAAATVSVEAEFEANTTKTSFEGNVRVSVPAYGIIDTASAGTGVVTLTLAKAGVPYAECTLALRSFKQNALGVASASYRVVAANLNGIVTEAPVGAACDDVASGNPVVPAVQAGDSIALSINATPVATGTIQ